MDTTLTGEDSREASLARWIKRTQEVLAFRSIHGLTFHRLYNLMRTKRLVEMALSNVLQNAGAKTAGIDGMTKARLDDDGRDRLIDELWQELCAKTYRPAPV